MQQLHESLDVGGWQKELICANVRAVVGGEQVHHGAMTMCVPDRKQGGAKQNPPMQGR